jgi:predicted DNA binding CopG/RHH family protein
MGKKENITRSSDELFDELFENTDFGDSKVEGVMIRRKGRPPIGRKFNVVMPEELIHLIEKAAKKKGVGYQTMIRIICSEKVSEYLGEKGSVA